MYEIYFCEETSGFIMDGKMSKYVGDFLYDIAVENNLTTIANSESDHLEILRASGLEIGLFEEDGSPLIY